MPNKSQHLALTLGDPRGIGPEIFTMSLKKGILPKEIQYHVYAPVSVLEKYGLNSRKRNQSKSCHFVAIPEDLSPGKVAGLSIEAAVKNILDPDHPSSALVTGPIDKSALKSAGYPYDGHTEMLAELSAAKNNLTKPQVTMMLANDIFRVSLASTHCSIAQVNEKLSREKILNCIENTAHFLQTQMGVKHASIAVLALNPHAGENGHFGREELDLIRPTMQEFEKKRKNLSLFGPYPADTFFAMELARPRKQRADAIIAMYHDQGLIPVKLVDFPQTVNITLGLPFIRTSVDHGTAFDIVGKNSADPSSFIAAIKWANKLLLTSRKSNK